MADEQDEVPAEIEQQCVDLHHAVAAVDRTLRPILSTNRTALGEKVEREMSGVKLSILHVHACMHLYSQMPPLDSASLSLLLCYTMNSLFWSKRGCVCLCDSMGKLVTYLQH